MIIVLATALLIAPRNGAFAHVPEAMIAAEASRHADLAPFDGYHGHSHDDGHEEERVPGHSHGHNPTDHVHDTGVALGFRVSEAANVTRSGPPPSEQLALTRRLFPPERPPRP